MPDHFLACGSLHFPMREQFSLSGTNNSKSRQNASSIALFLRRLMNAVLGQVDVMSLAHPGGGNFQPGPG